MREAVSVEEVLARLVEEVSGNVVPGRELARLERRASEQAREAGFTDLETFVRHLASHRSGAHWRSLLEFVTVNESYLFRAPQQFAALAEVILPDLVAARRTRRSLRLWSAGCARGEEAITLAMVCAESPHLAGWKWEILATDVDDAALVDARAGRYGARAVAKVPAPLLERYFGHQGSSWLVQPTLLSHIRYEHLNLVHEPLSFAGDCFDVILLRNVLIYFREASQRRVAAAMAEVLSADGALFLGPSESLWKLSGDLAPVDLGGCFVYRHRTTVAADAPPRPARTVPDPAEVPRPEGPPPRAATPPALSPQDVPPEPSPAPSHRGLVHALADGWLEVAAGLSRERLTDAPDDPVAHALHGLLEDAQGRTEDAVRSYRAALYLEPGLFQVRVLLARALARLGWSGRARHEYGEVLVILDRHEGRNLPDGELLALPSDVQAAVLARDALEQLPRDDRSDL